MPLCSNPYINGGGYSCPCNKCEECLNSRKLLWTHRIILEAKGHDRNSFVTLTYNEENHPSNGSLNREDLTKFIKRLRKTIAPQTLRFYACGEYGDNSRRPHYHLALFGLGEEDHGIIDKAWNSGKDMKGQTRGFTYTGELNEKSAAYTAGYIMKKMQYDQDYYQYYNLVPEFQTMSNGIGKHAAEIIVNDILKTPYGLSLLTPEGDVPHALKHGKKWYPLGKYLRQKCRELLDLPYTIEQYGDRYDSTTGECLYYRKVYDVTKLKKEIYRQEMQDMQENLETDEKAPEEAKKLLKQGLQYINHQDIINKSKRRAIYKSRKTI
jgi:hypothetical protein